MSNKVNLNTLKKWFQTGSKPTQEHFWAWMDSYWHKDESIPQESVDGLQESLNKKADRESLNNHVQDPEAHKKLFDTKADKNVFDQHLSDPGAHKSLFKNKVDISHLEDPNAHEYLFDQKVDKEPGKGLSSNDFTDDLKGKLISIQMPEDLQIFDSLEDAENTLGPYKFFLYSEKNSDGVVSPRNSVIGVTGKGNNK